MLVTGFEVQLGTVLIHCLRVMAEAFNTFGDLDECSERRYAQHFAMQDVAHTMLGEECFPDIRLKLLDAE